MINGGFGLVLDGSKEAEERAKMMLSWDVSNGVSKTYICVLYFFFNLGNLVCTQTKTQSFADGKGVYNFSSCW